MTNKDAILVSVICDVYNHEHYLRQCLDGFVMQKVNFNMEILIHDDASTDNSADIIREYIAKYPTLFKPIYQTENQYSQGKSTWRDFQIPRAKGKYVAFCEGDDFWTDSLKLQKQVDFLESHPEYGIVHTHARIYNQETGKYDGLKGKEIAGFEQLLQECTMATLTVMVRRELVLQYPIDIQPDQHGWKMGDYPLWLYCTTKMKIHFIPETTATYRLLANSASHSTDRNKVIQFWESSHDIQVFYAEREHVSSQLLHKINNAYEERIVCHMVHVSPEQAAKRLKQTKDLSIRQRLFIWMKIYRMKFLFKIGKNY